MLTLTLTLGVQSQIPVRTYNLKDLHSPSWSGAIPIRIEADTGEELGQIVFWAGKKVCAKFQYAK